MTAPLHLLVCDDPRFDGHESPPGHPERPERLSALRQGLVATLAQAHAEPLPAREARPEELSAVHTEQHVEELLRALSHGYGDIDPDTYFAPGTRSLAQGPHMFVDLSDIHRFTGLIYVETLKVPEYLMVRRTALELLGADGVVPQGPALTGSEDFAFMLERCPGSYLLIGNGDGDSAGACMVHNPGYDFNDANIAVGGAYWVLLAERFLAGQDKARAT